MIVDLGLVTLRIVKRAAGRPDICYNKGGRVGASAMAWSARLEKAVFRPEALLDTSATTYWTFISLSLYLFLYYTIFFF